LSVPLPPAADTESDSSATKAARYWFQKISRASLGSLIWIDKTPTESMEIPVSPFCPPFMYDYHDMMRMNQPIIELEIKPVKGDSGNLKVATIQPIPLKCQNKHHSSQVVIKVDKIEEEQDWSQNHDSGVFHDLTPSETHLLRVPSPFQTSLETVCSTEGKKNHVY
jgi:hypothetical protein